MSGVMYHIFFYKMVGLFGVGYVFNGAYHVYFFEYKTSKPIRLTQSALSGFYFIVYRQICNVKIKNPAYRRN